jgi:transposase
MNHFRINEKNRIFQLGKRTSEEKIMEIKHFFPLLKNVKETADKVGCSKNTVLKWRIREPNSISLGRKKGNSPKNNEFINGVLESIIESEATNFLDETQHALFSRTGQLLSLSYISRKLKEIGHSQVENQVLPSFRFTERVQTLRRNFRNFIKDFRNIHNLVVIDESHFSNLNLLRRKMRRVNGFVSPNPRSLRGGFSLLCAISMKKVVYYEIHESSSFGVNSEIFERFLKNLLSYLNNSQVILLDNASIHHTAAIKDLLNNTRTPFIFLPPYSPDYSAIEYLFNFIKTKIRRIGANETSLVTAVSFVLNFEVKGILLESFFDKMRDNWKSERL